MPMTTTARTEGARIVQMIVIIRPAQDPRTAPVAATMQEDVVEDVVAVIEAGVAEAGLVPLTGMAMTIVARL